MGNYREQWELSQTKPVCSPPSEVTSDISTDVTLFFVRAYSGMDQKENGEGRKAAPIVEGGFIVLKWGGYSRVSTAGSIPKLQELSILVHGVNLSFIQLTGWFFLPSTFSAMWSPQCAAFLLAELSVPGLEPSACICLRQQGRESACCGRI